MDFDRKQRVTLFRYSVIAPLETGSQDPSISNNEFFRQAAKKYIGPDEKPDTLGISTIEKWHRAYRKGGFEALFPRKRRDKGISRSLSPDLQTEIRFLLLNHPRITAAQIYRILFAKGDIDPGQVSLSTIERFVRLIRKKDSLSENNDNDMLRYERPHINEVWYGDTCFGRYMNIPGGKKRVYVIALIDDASRFIVGADLFFNDTFECFLSVIHSAVARYGKPKLFK